MCFDYYVYAEIVMVIVMFIIFYFPLCYTYFCNMLIFENLCLDVEYYIIQYQYNSQGKGQKETVSFAEMFYS